MSAVGEKASGAAGGKRAAALEPEKKATAEDIAEANARHGVRMPVAPVEVMFTELGWAVCRAGWIVKLFDRPSEAHIWLKGVGT